MQAAASPTVSSTPPALPSGPPAPTKAATSKSAPNPVAGVALEESVLRDLQQVFARGQDGDHTGLTPGFLEGVQHQRLVRGRNPRHRGVYLGKCALAFTCGHLRCLNLRHRRHLCHRSVCGVPLGNATVTCSTCSCGYPCPDRKVIGCKVTCQLVAAASLARTCRALPDAEAESQPWPDQQSTLLAASCGHLCGVCHTRSVVLCCSLKS